LYASLENPLAERRFTKTKSKMEVELRRKRNEVGKWVKTPEQFYELNSFDELQNIYDNLGLDFIIPVRSIWTYDISDEDFVNKIKSLDLQVSESKTELEKYLIREVNKHANNIELIKAGASIVFLE
jgi:hypothetical protein